MIDGEIVIAREGHLDFDALLLRIHPAASRVALLAKETPSSFVGFDLLALGDTDLREAPFSERRARLEEALAGARDGADMEGKEQLVQEARERLRDRLARLLGSE